MITTIWHFQYYKEFGGLLSVLHLAPASDIHMSNEKTEASVKPEVAN